MFILFINYHWVVSVTIIVFLFPRGLTQEGFKAILNCGSQFTPNFVPFRGRQGYIGVTGGLKRIKA